MSFEPRIPICAITDEFSPTLSEALPILLEIGMTAAELRVVDGRNIMDLTNDEISHTQEALQKAGLPVVSIASPILKCVLPGAPDLDKRFEHDIFASKHTFEDQSRLTDHAFDLAHRFGAKIIRVFSFWRTIDPPACHNAIVDHLGQLAEKASAHDLIIGLENEHACNIGTGTEAAAVLNALPHANLKLVWDPANALVAGEEPVPLGYSLLPANRIAHVHAKDCHMDGIKPIWGPLGTRRVQWKEQISMLISDNYSGFISLETHWGGPEGNKLEASRICGWNLKGLAAA